MGGSSNAFVKKDGVKAIRWESITEVVLDKPSTWTAKERVWYQQVMNMFGRKDPDTFLVPTADDLPEQRVVAIASEAITNAYNLPDDALDGFMPDMDLYIANRTVTGDPPRSDYRRQNVIFEQYRYDQGNTTIRSYSAIIDQNGHIVGDFELGVPHVQERAMKVKTSIDHPTPIII